MRPAGREDKQKEKQRGKGARENKGRTSGASWLASLEVRVKVSYTEVTLRRKKPKGKRQVGQLKLRNAGKKQDKLRLGIPN